MASSGSTLSLSALINAPAFVPPNRRKAKSGRPIAGPLGDGAHAGKRRGSGMELDSIGAFQDGDDPRHIDWSATARTGRPQVRRFLTTVQRPLAILVDLRSSMYFGTSEGLLAARACHEAAGLSAYLRQRREPFTIRSIGARIAPDQFRRKASTSARARGLDLDNLFSHYQSGLTADVEGAVPLAKVLSDCWDSLRFNYDIMVVSDFSDADEQLGDVISQRRQQSVHALIVSDPIFKHGFKSGAYPGRANSQAPVETYQLRKQDVDSQHEEIVRWRNDLVARLERDGLGTIWEPLQ